jgi:hypothetical protein
MTKENAGNHKEEKQSSPLILYHVQCPACGSYDVHHYALKAKSLPTHNNIFEVPVFEEAPKFSYVDYNELQFTVCPNCFFPGASRNDFITEDPVTHKPKESATNKKIIQYWKDNIKAMQIKFYDPKVKPDSFHNPRTPEAVLLSYKSAIFKAELEILNKIPYAYLKRAHRYIKYYCMNIKLTHVDDIEILRLALADLEEVFKISDFPDKAYEFEVCYLIVVICAKLNDEEKAGAYIKVLDITKGEITAMSKTNPRVPLQEVTKYSNKTKGFWQVRTDESIWDLSKTPNFG